MNYDIVSNDVRRANSRAVESRSRWRKQYNALSNQIRQIKRTVRESGTTDRNALITLDALVMSATVMMCEREWITADLRETAYRYAPKEMVTNPDGWTTLENVR